ncbi:hypothetical protein OWV82_013481 [Melia azedarach]|uniref:Uncharacterized protein n=1 Tax=Melia azedarach TaxID=155640 RepID=A0ACC1XUI9_MELAZ|nr:hypothetical protein OWV82_013481 [Melia azedarach]
MQDSPPLRLPSYVSEVIVQRGWHKFVQNPDPLLVAVVKEFYTNWLDPEEEVGTVRGTQVDCSVGAINQVYGLADIANEYSEFMKTMTEEKINEALQLTTKEGIIFGAGPTEEVLSNKASISIHTINRLLRDIGIKYPTNRDPPLTTSQATESSHSSDFSSIFERLDKQDTQHALLSDRLHKFWEYSHQRDQAIKRALQRNFTKPIPLFPDFPMDIFSPWTAATSPDDMASEEEFDN